MTKLRKYWVVSKKRFILYKFHMKEDIVKIFLEELSAKLWSFTIVNRKISGTLIQLEIWDWCCTKIFDEPYIFTRKKQREKSLDDLVGRIEKMWSCDCDCERVPESRWCSGNKCAKSVYTGWKENCLNRKYDPYSPDGIRSDIIR